MTKELTALAPSTIKIKDELRDGNIIIDGAESFRCRKVFFQPCSIGKEASGFYDTSFHNIMKCHVDIRKELFANVVLSGSTTVPMDL